MAVLSTHAARGPASVHPKWTLWSYEGAGGAYCSPVGEVLVVSPKVTPHRQVLVVGFAP